jgi:hypothetical protein
LLSAGLSYGATCKNNIDCHHKSNPSLNSERMCSTPSNAKSAPNVIEEEAHKETFAWAKTYTASQL